MDTEMLLLRSLIAQLVGGTLAMLVWCFRYGRRLGGGPRTAVLWVGGAVGIVLIDVGIQSGYALGQEIWGFPHQEWVRVLRRMPEIFLVFPLALLVLAARCLRGVCRGDGAWMRDQDIEA